MQEIKEKIKEIIKIFQINNIEPILVGGIVRDYLLGLKNSNDIDIEVYGNFDYEQLCFILKDFKPKIVGKEFGIIKINYNNIDLDISIPRMERSNGIKHTDFEVVLDSKLSFREAFQRRDFTINAIGYNLISDEFIDEFNGIADLKNKKLKTTSHLSFEEDPLRILRLARFYTKLKDFTISESTKKQIKQRIEELKKYRNIISSERITKETTKVFEYEQPSKYFKILLEVGALEYFYPEIYEMTRFEHINNKYHLEGSVFIHTMMVLDETKKNTDNVETLYGALYHDVLKNKTYDFDIEKQKSTFYDHQNEEEAIKISKEIKNKYNLSNDIEKTIKFSIIFHDFLHKLLDSQYSKKGIVKVLSNKHFSKNKEDIKKLFLISIADNNGRVSDFKRIIPYDEKIDKLIDNLIDIKITSLSEEELLAINERYANDDKKIEQIKNKIYKNKLTKASKIF